MGYWLNHGTGDHRFRPHRTADLGVAERDSDAELLARMRAVISMLEDLNARRRQQGVVAAQRSPQSREERRRIRLHAMRLAWEKRGVPWDEAEAQRVLAEVESRGEVRMTRWPVR